MKRSHLLILMIIAAAILLVGSYFLMVEIVFGPSAEVRAALKSDSTLDVSYRNNRSWLIFSPSKEPAKTGLILYPEGYQDIRMYAPLSRLVAQEGYQLVLLSRRQKFPPTFEEEEQRIADVMNAFPEVQTWFIGAHTWEAGIAAAYANRHPDRIAGVVLWAGRLSQDTSLADSSLPVLMVYGTLDDQNEQLVNNNRPFLPSQTIWSAIEGGNRVNFANFGPMPRDVGARISPQDQQAQAAAATLTFLKQNTP